MQLVCCEKHPQHTNCILANGSVSYGRSEQQNCQDASQIPLMRFGLAAVTKGTV